MTLRYTIVDDTTTVDIDVVEWDSLPEGTVSREVRLADDVQAFVTTDATGEQLLLGVELSNGPRFGDPFDLAAAERAVAWARTELAQLARRAV